MQGSLMPDRTPADILLEVLRETQNLSWVDEPFAQAKNLGGGTKVGTVGQEFVARLCRSLGVEPEFPRDKQGKLLKRGPWDISINGVTFEQKTATLGAKGTFQFNHIDQTKRFDALLCLGIAPDAIWWRAWSKADIVTDKAGLLVPMQKGSNAAWKITKKPSDLRPISDFDPARLVY